LAGELPVVLDAGALSAIADLPDVRNVVATRSGVTVVTPHVGEFRQLFPSVVGFDLESVRTAARELNVIVVAKGPRTLVVGPDGRAFVDIEASPAMGTAGSGDVLTGIIGGLLAGSALDTVDVVALVAAGVWIHSRAGRIAEAQLENPTAVDIGNMVGEVLRDL
jgi:NAD(P)H-hydrate epimerase